MDNQLALMKKLQKDPDTIAYAHNEEIVLIKRVVDDDGVRLTEVTLNPENGSKVSERVRGYRNEALRFRHDEAASHRGNASGVQR